MGGGKPPQAPDYTPLAMSAQANVQAAQVQADAAREIATQQNALGQQQFNLMSETAGWARDNAQQQLDLMRAQFDQNKGVLDQVLSVQIPAMQQEAAQAQSLRERYNSVFQPIEDKLIAEANSYATPERADFNAGQAIQDVSAAFDASRSNALARMESYGVDPSQTRMTALDAGIRVQEAAAKAAAGTQSRLNTEATGRAMQGEVANMGRGLPASIAQAYSTSQNAGQVGMGSANNTATTGAGTMGTGVQWAGLVPGMSSAGTSALGAGAGWMNAATGALGAGNGAIGQWNSALNNGFNNLGSRWRMNQERDQAMGSAIGGIAGMVAGVAGFQDGGPVPHDPADPSGKGDTINAALSGGEFVIPTSVTRRLGSEKLDKLIVKYGDEGDRRAALERLKTGRPGGEPVHERRRTSALGLQAVA